MAHHLPITAVRCRSLTTGRQELTWEVGDTSIDVWDYTFQVLRSESPEGPYSAVSEPFEDRYIFVDTQVPVGNKLRQLWYVLRVVHKATETVRDEKPVTHEAEPDLVADYIRRQEQTAFTQVIGRMCWLFKKRTFGTRCGSCWDTVMGKRTRAGCLDCFDTGFLRGYHNPIEIWAQVDPPGQSKQNRAQQINTEAYTGARLTFYPNVTIGDLLVEAENKRWRVTRVTKSERLRAPIKQELVLYQVQDTDIEYKLPLNLAVALRDIQPSPVRMFTNPADLEAAIDRQIPNVFANYPTYPSNASEE